MIEPIRRVIVLAGLVSAACAPFFVPDVLSPFVSPSLRLAAVVLAVTAAIYVLLPRPRFDAPDVCFDPVPAVWVVDVVGAVCTIGVTGGLMAMAEPPDAGSAALASAWGLAVGLPWCLWAAYHATYAIRVENGRLRLSTWRGVEEWVLADVRTARPHFVGGNRSGVVLIDASEEVLRLDWTGLLRFGRVLDALREARVPWEEEEVWPCGRV